MVDPLDGTREFVKRNGEFTVNIALVVDHEPVLGLGIGAGPGAAVLGQRREWARSAVTAQRPRRPFTSRRRSTPLRVVGSRSHASKETAAYLDPAWRRMS